MQIFQIQEVNPDISAVKQTKDKFQLYYISKD